MQIDEDLARSLLEEYPVPDGVLKHMEDVKRRVVKLVEELRNLGWRILNIFFCFQSIIL